MGVRATTSYSGPAASGRTGLSAGAAAGAAAAAAGAATAPAVVAASTSRRMIRPPGPVPWISRRSSPAWAATFRASGETRRRSATGAAGTAAAAELTAGAGAAAGATLLGTGAAGAGETAGGALAAGLGPPASASTGAMSSPGSAMTPISEPTGARSPAGTTIFRRTPAPKASISTSALSVSISATMSPLWTRSPSFRSHLMTLPVSMASESLGITTLVTAMSVSPRSCESLCGSRGCRRPSCRSAPVRGADFADRLGDALVRGRLGALQVPGIGHRRVGAGDALDRRVEVVERLLGDEGGDLRPHPGEARARLDHDRAVGLPHRADDRLGVHRAQGSRIDHLDRQTLRVQLGGDLHRAVHHAHIGDDRHVPSLPAHDRLAEGNREVWVVGNLALDRVERLGLDEDHRVIVADRRLQEPLGDLVGAVVETDLLAEDEHPGIALHLLAERHVERLAIGHHRHPQPSL